MHNLFSSTQRSFQLFNNAPSFEKRLVTKKSKKHETYAWFDKNKNDKDEKNYRRD